MGRSMGLIDGQEAAGSTEKIKLGWGMIAACLMWRQAGLGRTNGCCKSEWDAEPEEAAQQVAAHRGRGARSDGALPVCLNSAKTGSAPCILLSRALEQQSCPPQINNNAHSMDAFQYWC